jgi:hypothetical protein
MPCSMATVWKRVRHRHGPSFVQVASRISMGCRTSLEDLVVREEWDGVAPSMHGMGTHFEWLA